MNKKIAHHVVRRILRRDLQIALLCVMLNLVFLILDLLTPLGVATGMLYAISILVSLFSESRQVTWFVVALSYLLVLIGFLLSPHDGVAFWIAAINRAMSALVIGTSAVLGLQLQEAKTTLADRERKLEETNARLADLANRDALTGLYNRRYFDQQLQREFQRASREGNMLSVLLLDVDYLKDYNDTQGHPAGDDVLIRVAQAIQASLRRPGDLAARYGGDEFAVVLPRTDAVGAHRRAEAIQKAISGSTARPRSHHLTLSIGTATVSPTSDRALGASLVSAADQALYRAKQNGRNQIQSQALSETRIS